MVGRLQPVSPEQTRAVLWRDPLKNVVLLKFLLACRDGATVYQVARAGRVATLLVIDHRASAYDRQTYPATRASAIIASDDPALTREVVTAVSPDDRVIFKLASEEDRQAVGERFALARVTAFHSYTAANHEPTATGCEIGAAADAPFDLFEAQGHDPEWLHGLLRSGRAFTSLVRAGRETRAACFAFEIDGSLWEIGGVYTGPAHRGRGLAKQVVRAALTELRRLGRLSRYQVSEDNGASIGVAESLGMKRFLTLTHYRNEGRAA
jgi:ribosomal protein S18 acetylase RimI-like enzyme